MGNRTIMMDEGRLVLDLKGEERAGMTVDGLLALFRAHSEKEGTTTASCSPDRIRPDK